MATFKKSPCINYFKIEYTVYTYSMSSAYVTQQTLKDRMEIYSRKEGNVDLHFFLTLSKPQTAWLILTNALPKFAGLCLLVHLQARIQTFLPR